MADSPKISIIVPTYNRYHLLKNNIEVFLKQTYVNKEILVIDDASPDNTPDIAMDFPEIRYIRNEHNLGFAGASEKGLMNATGDFVIFWGDDDNVLDDRFLEKAVPLVGTGTDAVFGRSSVLSDNIQVFSSYPFKNEYSGREFIQELMNMNFFFIDHIAFSSFLFRRERLISADPFTSVFPNCGSIDISGLMKFCMICGNIRFADTHVYQWCKSTENSISNRKRDDMAFQTIQTVSAGLEFYRKYKDTDYEFVKEVCNKYALYSFNAILNDYYDSKSDVHFEQLYNDLDKEKNYIIYCAGWISKKLEAYLVEKGIRILAVVDDFKENYPSFENIISEISQDTEIIIATYKYPDSFKISKKISKLTDAATHQLVSYI